MRGLTDQEMKEQGARCGCRGSDDYCACQNEPDHITRAKQAMTSPSDTIRNAALKRNTVFVFDDGVLTIKQSGHGKADGWAELAFHEEQVEVDADGYHKVEIPPSELTELRDFLVRNLPASPGEPVAWQPVDEVIFWYRNYRGEEGYRRVRPISMRWGSSEYHPEPQWLLLALDLEKNAEREFALKDASGVVNATPIPFAAPQPVACPSKEELIALIMEATTDRITSDGLADGRAPNALVQGCKFILRRERMNPTEGYADPEHAAKGFAGFIADAIRRRLFENSDGGKK